jgi:hypothetical protein
MVLGHPSSDDRATVRDNGIQEVREAVCFHAMNEPPSEHARRVIHTQFEGFRHRHRA